MERRVKDSERTEALKMTQGGTFDTTFERNLWNKIVVWNSFHAARTTSRPIVAEALEDGKKKCN